VIDVQQYLRRIDYHGPVRPDAATLAALHRAHLATVPYENLDIQLGRPLSLERDALFDKIVQRRRGGFCFELNGAFSLLLSAVGFPVRLVEAAVHRDRHGESAWGNHLALLVFTDNASFLVDVGFGDGFLEPLPLRIGTFRQGPLVYQLRRDLSGLWRMVHHPAGSTPGFDFRTQPRQLTDFAAWCARLATEPDSPFLDTLLVQQPRTDHALVLRGRNVIRQGAAGRMMRELTDRAAFESVLAGDFGVPLADLGADGLAELWRRAGEQTAAWKASQISSV
jgi:N-hydroxyarylamine O-acetyltransferase